MIYLSIIGNHDQVSPEQGFGAALTIFRQYKHRIERVFLLATPAKAAQRMNYHEIAQQNRGLMLAEKPGLAVDIVDLNLDNPIDFDLVYPVLLDTLQQLLSENGLAKSEKIINITSGTPTMTACWVLLHQSGLVSNATLVQSFETRYARQRGRSTQEVNLSIDDFPEITAPAQLKRQLTILKREKNALQAQVGQTALDQQFPGLIGQSEAIREIKEQLLKDINQETHVLITGERGTGKQVIANAIWQRYHHADDEVLTTFDCGTIAKDLIASELFGYTKGAFTGAIEDREGILRQSDGRMLFLDEIGNLPMTGQQALLRYITNGEVRKVGGSEVVHVNTQIIAATNKDITDPEIFAQDLKDRFDEIIKLPPLRDRREDIAVIIDHFLEHYQLSTAANHSIVFDSELTRKLVEYHWPGNVRELQKWVQRVCRRFKSGTVKFSDLPNRFIEDIMQADELDDLLPELPLPVNVEEYIKRIREKARGQAGGNHAEVDRLLKQNPGTEKQRQYRKRGKK